VNSVAVSSDGRYVLSASEDNSIKVWALNSGQCLRTLEEHSGPVNFVAVCPDGRYVLSGSDDSTIKLWAIDTGQCFRTLEGHTGYVNSVAVSPDGGYVLSGSSDSTIKVWDISTGQCLRILEGHSGRVNSVVVSPDGQYVISGSSDHSLIIWRLIWDIRFPDAVGWDDRVLPFLEILHFLEIFLELHQGKWTEDDWQTLVTELQARGLGWIRPVGIRKKLVELTQKYATEGQLWLRERYGRGIACPLCHRKVVNDCSVCAIKVDNYINALNCDNSAKKTGQRALDLIVDFNKVWAHSARFVDFSKYNNLEKIFNSVAVVMLILVWIVSHWYWGLLVGGIISGLGRFWIVYDRGVKTAKAVRQFLPTIRKQLAKDNIGFVAAVLRFWVKESPKTELVRPTLQKELGNLWNLNKAANQKQFHFFKKSLERFKEAINSQVLTKKAIENYDKVLQSNQENHEAWYNRGNALAQLGRHEEAIKSYDKALLFKGDYHKAWYNRGNALAQLGRGEAAIDSYDKALLFKGDDSVVWNNRGLALRNLGRYEEAIESFDRALQFKPNDNVAWNNRGVALRNLGCYEEAIDSYDQALQFKPNDNVAWNSRGIALAQLGRHEEAIESYDKALHFKPDLNEALNNRGVALRNLGRYKEAIKSFDRALRLKPNDREAWNNRCIALGELGRREDAIES
jgi:tetratricopeptide (TPR) repeat protein